MLWELLDTPLMLTIVTLAYAGQPAEVLRTGWDLGRAAAVPLHCLCERDVPAPERRNPLHPPADRALAPWPWQLAQHNQSVFYLERLQPDWLPLGRRWLPTLGARLRASLGRLVFGLGVGLIFGLRAASG